MKKKIHHGYINYKKAKMALLIPDNVDFRVKNITTNKEGHFIMIIHYKKIKNAKYLNPC